MLDGLRGCVEGHGLLFCHIKDVCPGMLLGAAVVHPRVPDMELLRAGVRLEGRLLSRLESLGIEQVWVHHDLAADLDAVVSPRLTAAKMGVYQALKEDLDRIARGSVTAIDISEYRRAVGELVLELMVNRQFAGLTDQLFASRRDEFTHAANVAYISTIVGIELQYYIQRERSRLSPEHARDLTSLGLGAMLHDIGKTELDEPHRRRHEVGGRDAPRDDAEPNDPERDKGYRRHTVLGYRLLRHAQAPASARQIVLNHHQHFDGQGWPDIGQVTGRNEHGPQVGRQIHVFTRIAAAANVLDNLLADHDGSRRPSVAALSAFASHEYDGWFDPVVRACVLRRIPPFAVGSAVTLSDGRKAVVIAPCPEQPCRPTVRLLEPPKRNDDGPTNLELTQHPELSIVECAGVDVQRWTYEMPAPVEALAEAA